MCASSENSSGCDSDRLRDESAIAVVVRSADARRGETVALAQRLRVIFTKRGSDEVNEHSKDSNFRAPDSDPDA